MKAESLEHIESIDLTHRDVFSAMYDEFFGRLCLFAYKMLPDFAMVEDTVNDVFIRLLHRGGQFHGKEHLKAYLYRAVRNAILNTIRAQTSAKSRESDFQQDLEKWIEPVQLDIIRSEYYAHLYDAIQRLPEQCRSVLELGYFEGIPNAEIADRLGISVQTVKNHKHRALGLLKNLVHKDSFFILLSLSYQLADESSFLS